MADASAAAGDAPQTVSVADARGHTISWSSADPDTLRWKAEGHGEAVCLLNGRVLRGLPDAPPRPPRRPVPRADLPDDLAQFRATLALHAPAQHALVTASPWLSLLRFDHGHWRAAIVDAGWVEVDRRAFTHDGTEGSLVRVQWHRGESVCLACGDARSTAERTW